MKKLIWVSFVALGCVWASSTKVYSEFDKNAAKNAWVFRSNILTTMDVCSKEPTLISYKFEFAKYLWEKSQYRELEISKVIMTHLTSDFSKTIEEYIQKIEAGFITGFAKKTVNQKTTHCANVLKNVMMGKTAYQNVIPQQAPVLRKLFTELVLEKNFERNQDFVVGCMKGVFSKGSKDFLGSKKMCHCMLDTFVKYVSDDDINTYLKPGEGELQNPEKELWFSRVQPLWEQCSEGLK
jgi:hypothetical protein